MDADAVPALQPTQLVELAYCPAVHESEHAVDAADENFPDSQLVQPLDPLEAEYVLKIQFTQLVEPTSA